jgi:hypothetical protein
LSCAEIKQAFEPDNGLVSAAYDLVTSEFLNAEFLVVKSELNGNHIVTPSTTDSIADPSILCNSDSVLFYVKELSASHEDSSLIHYPTVYTKLDMKTLNEFDFEAAQPANTAKKVKRDHRRSDITKVADKH